MAGAYHLRIRSSRGFAGFNLRELWDFRGLLAALAIRDIKLRYRQTALGVGGPSVGWEIITLPVWLGILLIFAFGLGLVSAVLSARLRDVQHITPVLLQLSFYASPVAYQSAAVPEKWRGLFLLNPLVPLFEGLRWSLLREGHFRGLEVAYSLFVSAFTLVFGLFLFRRAEREFADVM